MYPATEAHKCPDTRSRLQQCLDVVVDDGIAVQTRITGLAAYRREWQEIIKKVEEKFTPHLRGMIAKAIQRHIDAVRKLREGEYAKHDEWRAQGISFADRQSMMDHRKITMCDEREKKLMDEMKKFRPRKISEWMEEGDYEEAKQKGFSEMIFKNLNRTYE